MPAQCRLVASPATKIAPSVRVSGFSIVMGSSGLQRDGFGSVSVRDPKQRDPTGDQDKEGDDDPDPGALSEKVRGTHFLISGCRHLDREIRQCRKQRILRVRHRPES